MMNIQNKVRISADSPCDLTPQIRKQYRIPLMYCYIHTEEARFRDTKEISTDNLIEYIDQLHHHILIPDTLQYHYRFQVLFHTKVQTSQV